MRFLGVPAVSANYISEFTGTGIYQNGLTGGGSVSSPVALALGPSGNLWTANSGDNSVTLFVGLAAPTITPLVARTQ